MEAKLYAEHRGGSIEVPPNGISMIVLTWSAIISPTLLPLITACKIDKISYNSQRMKRQLGYDKSAVQFTGEMGCSNFVSVESQFVGRDKKLILITSKLHKVFWPDVARVGVRT